MTEETSSPAPVATSTSPWPIIGWLLFGVSVLVIGIAAGAGLLMPAVILDVVSFWPAWVLALLIALALWPLRRRGLARIGAVLPLLLFSWLAAAVGLHLLEWSQLPSASADIRGPDGSGITSAEVGIEVGGAVTLRPGAETLYDVRLVRTGGDTGPPDALERLVPAAAVIELRERPGAGWFRSSGWRVRLQRGPAWDVSVIADQLDISTRGIDLRSLQVAGDGVVTLGLPSVDATVELAGDVVVTVPAGAAVRVEGPAGVPETWTTTETGFQSPGTGSVITIVVAEGTIARVVEG